MIYITNAFSLQMMDCSESHTVSINPIEVADVISMLRSNDFTSGIGHADTANVISDLLNTSVPFNRISIALTPNDTLIVAQIVGGRLPEGSTTIPDGMSIKFLSVSIK